MSVGYRISIIGVGLIGGSIARRLKFSGFANYVLGIGRNEERLSKAKDLGIIDEFGLDYVNIKDSDIVIIATPVDHIISHLPQILECCSEGSVVVDVGSVKVPIVNRYNEIKANFENKFFVPSHPIAGSHLTGFEHAKKDLFMGYPAVICNNGLSGDVVDKVKLMYNFLGMDVYFMDPQEHDYVMGYLSHLTHLLSFSYRDIINQDYLKFAGGSFRDMVRVSSADLHLWNGIFRHNRENVSLAGEDFLKSFSEKLNAIKEDREVVVSYLPSQRGESVYSVAIDGPAGAGKSTIAKLLAMRLGFRLIDTGAMYRAATLLCMRKGVDLENSEEVLACVKAASIELGDTIPPAVYLNGEDVSDEIRRPEVTNNVFYLARDASVREYLVSIQRELALKGRAVIEGRDITTVVIPEARFKFYLDASFEERFIRRVNDLKQRKIDFDEEKLKADMFERDANDLKRDVGPLRKASDAFYIDSTNLSIEHTLNTLFYEIKRRVANEEINL